MGQVRHPGKHPEAISGGFIKEVQQRECGWQALHPYRDRTRTYVRLFRTETCQSISSPIANTFPVRGRYGGKLLFRVGTASGQRRPAVYYRRGEGCNEPCRARVERHLLQFGNSHDTANAHPPVKFPFQTHRAAFRHGQDRAGKFFETGGRTQAIWS